MTGLITSPDLFSADFAADPHAAFNTLRNNEPVHWNAGWNGWILTRYDDVSTLLRDDRLSLEGGVAAMFDRLPNAMQRELAPLRRHISLWLGALPPDEHRRLRAILQRGFTATIVERTRELTESIADDLLKRVIPHRRVDLVSEFAYPLPAAVIAGVLGTPKEDWHLFQRWSKSLTQFIAYGLLKPEVMFEARDTVVEMTGYLRQQIEDRPPSSGGSSLIDQLLDTHSDAASLDEILANCVLLLFAGHETTTLLIGNAARAILADPNRVTALQHNPGLLQSAMDEVLRYESPIQLVRRIAVMDITIDGVTIRKDDIVWLCLSGANRDGTVFPLADSFDIQRSPNRHVAFGAGSHYCLGARLSVMEGMVALQRLISLPGVRLAEPDAPQWHINPTARALVTLPVEWDRD